jgi:D-alanyl-D-alanine carboxypeptidase/D-alanyl-D-alanine-endopeptidase (penicillin-binding protein 4)
MLQLMFLRLRQNRSPKVILPACALLLQAASVRAADPAAHIGRLAGKDGIVYAVNNDGKALFEIGATRTFIPASTVKVFTALLAIEHLGLDWRFETEFYLNGNHLVVHGKGDPLLVSEELDRAAAALAPLLYGKKLAGVLVDDGFFASDIRIPGVGRSSNPYDALNSATAVNFNTIGVRGERGRLFPAEPQTPLTPLARELGRRRRVNGEDRFSLGDRPDLARRYAAELVAAKLREHGVTVGDAAASGTVPANTPPLYVHRNSRTLAEVCTGMLRYSSNFTANQILLAVGAATDGPTASLEKSLAVAERFIAAHPPLRDLHIVEGSGISYDNRATAPALAALLELFEPHKNLLKDEHGTRHKTGTLNSVASLIGYLDTPTHGTVRYVIALDGNGRERRWKIVDSLRKAL